MDVLVAYATKHGATAEIDQKVAQVLRQAGLEADALPADRVGDLSPYRGGVLGSGVYLGRWRTIADALTEAASTPRAQTENA